jgi:hypothetical protein
MRATAPAHRLGAPRRRYFLVGFHPKIRRIEAREI